jgi:DNA transposition AAA+ family ATPase
MPNESTAALIENPSRRIIAQKAYDADLLNRLIAFRAERGLSIAELARMLGATTAPVSKYLNRKPEGDVEKLEARIADVLKAAALRTEIQSDIFPTFVTTRVSGSLETIRKAPQVGLIYGPAGVGKTCGLKLYLRESPSAVPVFATPWKNSRSDVEIAVFTVLDTRRWDTKTRRADAIVEHLSGSHRLIVIDDAHLLSLNAIKWCFWMHRETGCSVALIANPELLDVIKRNDQMFSCIGLREPITSGKTDEILKSVRALLALHAPEEADVLEDLALQVASKEGAGHLRALTMQLALAREMRALTAKLANPRDAFIAAHAKLFRSYQLEA